MKIERTVENDRQRDRHLHGSERRGKRKFSSSGRRKKGSG